MDAPFLKMHGCGNDFVVLDARAHALGITPARAAAIADRRTGIGCDQVIILEPRAGRAPTCSCASATPTAARPAPAATPPAASPSLLAAESGRAHAAPSAPSPATCRPQLHADGSVTVDMGQPRLDWHDIPLAGPADTLHLDLAEGPVADPAACSMGNPHATFFVADLAALPVEQIGPRLEHAAIFPERANIGFAQMLAPDRIRLRVWERGAGLTLRLRLRRLRRPGQRRPPRPDRTAAPPCRPTAARWSSNGAPTATCS